MEQLVNFIIRPPRAEYNPKNDLLDQEFMLKGKWFQRKDLEVVNSRGDILQCTHYMPTLRPEGKPLPCVIYCHGNSGCRADASEAAIILLPSNITVFTLDFSGSGRSGGEHVTLGWNEKDDLRAVVDYLRADGNVSLIGLWGRSMGAVTSLMYGAEDPSIAGMVLDSPFSDLVDLMMELVDTYKIRLPKFTVKFAIQYMRRAVQKKANFDMMELNTIKVAKTCFVPVLFGHAIDDDFIQPHHSDHIFDAYVGDKNIIKFEGDHNSPRPQFYFDSISIFFNNVLQPPEDEAGVTYFGASHDYFSKDSPNPQVGYADDFFFSHSGADTAASSTEDAINQVRLKRQMSKIEVPADISSNGKKSDGQGEGSGTEPLSSSSKMISFEFANGHPYDPASIDDDEYIEYPLDNLADFPCSAEEEERMLMKAVMESLKDQEMHPLCDEQPNIRSDLPKPSQKSDTDVSMTDEHSVALRSESSDPESASGVNACDLTAEVPCDAVASPKASSSNGASCIKELESTGASADEGVVGSSDSDMADQTKATVTVVKNPSSNIMDGLIRRWDLSFFRNR